MSSAQKRICKAQRRDGQACQARALTPEGFCAMHGGLTDPRAIGAKGGRGRTGSMLGISDAVADDKLRGQAKEALEAALNSDNEAVRLRAAQSLYAFRPTEAPREPVREPEHEGRGVFSIGDLVRRAIELGVVEVSREGEVLIGGVPVEIHTPFPQKLRTGKHYLLALGRRRKIALA